MSKGEEKIIDIDDDDELEFLLSLLTDAAFDPRLPLEPSRSDIGTRARRMSPEITSLSRNSGEVGTSGSSDTLSEEPSGDLGVKPSPETPRPEVRSRAGVELYHKITPLT
ncbi:hypothetical protein AB3S75_012302 [Citrus x aurantiifolia]